MRSFFVFAPLSLLTCCDSETHHQTVKANAPHSAIPVNQSKNDFRPIAGKAQPVPPAVQSEPESTREFKAAASPFNEALDISERKKLLSEFSASNDQATLEGLASHIDVPFMENGKQNVSELLASRDWEVFPCVQILRKKGSLAVPAPMKELSNPSPSISDWSKNETNKPLQILRILRFIVGFEQLEQLLAGMADSPHKESAMNLFKMMKPKPSQ
ncbi:MAG: hypothetical protein EOP86_16790 [Verrucomicrobiaceae bacterium]|nr:MAG: hypothetical protein EOP86_16790 [Verrucomicrobiaceae bacterium]